jgi:hypothetical protein
VTLGVITHLTPLIKGQRKYAWLKKSEEGGLSKFLGMEPAWREAEGLLSQLCSFPRDFSLVLGIYGGFLETSAFLKVRVQHSTKQGVKDTQVLPRFSKFNQTD